MSGTANGTYYNVDPTTLTTGASTLNSQVSALESLLASTKGLLSQLNWNGSGYQAFERDLITWNSQVQALQQTLGDLKTLLNQAAIQYGGADEGVRNSLSSLSA